jgi:hypothetical protein
MAARKVPIWLIGSIVTGLALLAGLVCNAVTVIASTTVSALDNGSARLWESLPFEENDKRFKKLGPKSGGAVSIHRPLREPSKTEKEAGLLALAKWESSRPRDVLWVSADGKEQTTMISRARLELVDDIVIGKTLIGLSKSEIVCRLGPSDDQHPYRGGAPKDGLFYDVTNYEDYCYLCIDIRNGKAVDVWLNANY